MSPSEPGIGSRKYGGAQFKTGRRPADRVERPARPIEPGRTITARRSWAAFAVGLSAKLIHQNLIADGATVGYDSVRQLVRNWAWTGTDRFAVWSASLASG